MESSKISAPRASSCSSCSSARPAAPAPSMAIEGTSGRPTGAYREFSDRIYATVGANRIPLNATIELTENCNFRCVHCYQGKNKARLMLNGDQWCNILNQFVAEGSFWLLITGGEPLLHPEFERIYRHAISLGLITTVFTNGRLVKEQHLRLWQELPPFAVEVTLYGKDEETYAQVTGTKGSFATVIENCKRIKAAGIPLKLKSVAFHPLYGQMKELKRIAEEEIGVPFRFDTKIDPGIYGDSFDEIRPTAEETVRLEQEIVEGEALKVDLETLMQANKKMLQETDALNLLYHCGAGKNSFYVDYQGLVHTCSTGRLFEEKIDLREISFREAWQLRLPAVVYQEAKNRDPVCKACDFRAVCSVCPATAKLATGSKEGRPMYICQHTMARKMHFFGSTEKKTPSAAAPGEVSP